MKTNPTLDLRKGAALLLLLLSGLISPLSTVFAQGTAFTYQGRLNDGGPPANGSYVLRFTALDGPNGNQVGNQAIINPATVSNGLFTVDLDFGPGVFTGPARWLSIEVHTNDNLSDFVLLTPVQAMLPAPYAIYAEGANAAGITGVLPDGSLSGNYSKALNLTNPNNTHAGDGGGLTNVNAAKLGGLAAANFWQTSGNAGTTPGVNFVGTTDGQPLELRANGQRVMRFDKSGSSPNILGGYSGNSIGAGLTGVTIAGGGVASGINEVDSSWGTVSGGSANFILNGSDNGVVAGGGNNIIDQNAARSVISGGFDNIASAMNSVIAGGQDHWIKAGASNSAVGGGQFNYVEVASHHSVIAGGENNSVGTGSDHATISGGNGNTIQTNAYGSTIGGGLANANTSHYGTISGGAQNLIDSTSFGTIGGGLANWVHGYLATVSGGANNNAQADGSTVSGGDYNWISINANASVIGGGSQNTNEAQLGTIAGGYRNTVHGQDATVGGGYGNVAGGQDATVAGGSGNAVTAGQAAILGGIANTNNSWEATIGGGALNLIQSGAADSTVSGGRQNLIAFGSPSSTISGGFFNQIDSLNNGSLISGGNGNYIASGAAGAAIVGGYTNSIGPGALRTFIGGGYLNTIWDGALDGVIGGGYQNQIFPNSGYAVIGGGSFNKIGPGPSSGLYATLNESVIGGGTYNEIRTDCQWCNIGGGYDNVIWTNVTFSVIGGGSFNLIFTNAVCATVPGGSNNKAAGDYSFAAGRGAQALHHGSFVWADASEAPYIYLQSTNDNSFTARADGGYRLFSSSNMNAGVFLAHGGTSWSAISDRNVKKDFAPLDARAILEKLSAIPVTRWHYQWEEASATPHIGPMAQDFKAAFYPGSDDKSISTQEADGVEFAAIQGLNQKVEEQRAELKQKQTEIAELKQRMERLEQLLNEKLNGGTKLKRTTSQTAATHYRSAKPAGSGECYSAFCFPPSAFGRGPKITRLTGTPLTAAAARAPAALIRSAALSASPMPARRWPAGSIRSPAVSGPSTPCKPPARPS